MLLVAVPEAGDVVAQLSEDGCGLRLTQCECVRVRDEVKRLELGVFERKANEGDGEAVNEKQRGNGATRDEVEIAEEAVYEQCKTRRGRDGTEGDLKESGLPESCIVRGTSPRQTEYARAYG